MDQTQKRELLRLNRLNKKYSKLDTGGAYNKYVNDYIRIKMVKGKPIKWDTRTNKKADDNVIQKAVNQKLFGTSTPYKDAEYLKGLNELSIMKSRDKNDAFANLRRQFSPKTVNKGERLIDVKRNLKYEDVEKNLESLRVGTSYGRRDVADIKEQLLRNTQASISDATGGSSEDQAAANSQFIANGGEALPFKNAGVLGTELYQTHGGVKLDKSVGSYNEGEDFQPDAESLTGGKAKESLKISEDPKLTRAKLFVKRHASGKNSVALQKAKLYIREHEG